MILAWYQVFPLHMQRMSRASHLAHISKRAGLRMQWHGESTWNGEVIGIVEGFILWAISLFVSLHIATLVYTSYSTKTNTSLNNKSLFFLLADQPHWYITCFPLRPFACLWF
jgi:hypothetical protein